MQKHAKPFRARAGLAVLAIILVFALGGLNSSAVAVSGRTVARVSRAGWEGPSTGTPEDGRRICRAESGRTGGTHKQVVLLRKRTETPFDRVKAPTRLWTAWRHVKSKGMKSVSRETRDEILAFDREADREIPAIYRKLHTGKFTFAPAKPVLKKREGKAPRPIVIAPVESRMVQRSILNALGKLSAMKPFFTVPTSFGMRGVPRAVEAAYSAMRLGGEFYIRSDIESFFTQIPRRIPCEAVARLVNDAKFARLLDEATRVDLVNAAMMGRDLDYFPDDELGVAQGCALSTLMGNVLLYEFDRAMNDYDVVCFRYVDDFLLLGPKPSRVRKAFANGQEILGKLGLRAYDPEADPEKAFSGWTNRRWEFLGCEIMPGIVRPTGRAKRRLLDEIDWRIAESIAAMSRPIALRFRGGSFAKTIEDIDRLTRGWGNQYSFCNDHGGVEKLERDVWHRLQRYQRHYEERVAGCGFGRDGDRDRQRLLGAHLLSDSNSDPIVNRVHGS